MPLPADFARLFGRSPPELRALARAARALILRAVPAATERVRLGWGLLGFDAPRYFACVAPQGDVVRIGFEHGIMLDDPDGLLEGSGAQMRWVTVRRAADLEAPGLPALCAEAAEISATAASGRQRARAGIVRAMGKSQVVDAWFAKLEHPQKPAMLLARQVILEADPRIEEAIKWQCPTFMFGGNLASINPRAKSHVSLLFHTGAHIPGKHPRLEGGADTARFMKLADVADVKASRKALEAVVRAWCAWKAAAPAKAATKRTLRSASSRPRTRARRRPTPG